jgi:putative endonuclease
MEKAPCVYMLASAKDGTLYIGVTGNLPFRVAQHRARAIDGFTKTYGVDRLVWFERHERMEDAVVCEKQMKKWKRAWKIRMIMQDGSQWRDLYLDIV